MHYAVEITDEAKATLRAMPREVRRAIGHKISLLEDNMSGDVQKLRASRNQYRLRVGHHRVLFELEGDRIVVYAVGDRKEIYR